MSRKRQEPARLKAARHRFSKWRETREGRARIPQPLWELAVELGKEYGVSLTSRALSVSYSDLRRRICKEDGEKRSDEPSFLEFPVAGISHCSVELENRSGSRLKVELKGGEFPDVSELVQVFCEQKR